LLMRERIVPVGWRCKKERDSRWMCSLSCKRRCACEPLKAGAADPVMWGDVG
jgi:hypothetical protein